MNVFRTSESKRNLKSLYLTPTVVLRFCALLCGAIFSFLLPVDLARNTGQTCPKGNEDPTCDKQGIRESISTRMAPGECNAFPVEAQEAIYSYVEKPSKPFLLREHKKSTWLNKPKLYDPLYEPIRERPDKEENRWIFAVLQGPIFRAKGVTHTKLIRTIGALRGTIHVQINAPEYSAG